MLAVLRNICLCPKLITFLSRLSTLIVPPNLVHDGEIPRSSYGSSGIRSVPISVCLGVSQTGSVSWIAALVKFWHLVNGIYM